MVAYSKKFLLFLYILKYFEASQFYLKKIGIIISYIICEVVNCSNDVCYFVIKCFYFYYKFSKKLFINNGMIKLNFLCVTIVTQQDFMDMLIEK